MFESIKYAYWGTIASVIGLASALIFCELFVLVLSARLPPQNVIDAVADLAERDARRLELLHASSLVELSKDLPPVTFSLGEADTPVGGPSADPSGARVVSLSLAHKGTRP